MYSNDRDAYRQAYFTAWQKHQKRLIVEPFEAQLIKVILLHPEYHALLEKPSGFQHLDFSLEENPFVHMSLHMSLNDQIRSNKPAGVTSIYAQLLKTEENSHTVEHRMMQCLAHTIWQAQQEGEPPNENIYLESLRQLLDMNKG